MVNRSAISIENNFIGGLKTEYTALNFPENACTFAENTTFSIVGEVDRRGGFDFETNYQLNSTITSGGAQDTYKWNNVAGDGETQIIVEQSGGTLYFYLSSSATATHPLSTQILISTANVSSFVASGGLFDNTVECTFADGNGYLFVFHPNCDPFYCTFNTLTNVITSTVITVDIRDFVGYPEPGVPFNLRPISLTAEHNYNLANQGWTGGWQTSSLTPHTLPVTPGSSVSFTVTSSTLPIVVGQTVLAQGPTSGSGASAFTPSVTGTVTSYVGNVLTITEVSQVPPIGVGVLITSWTISPPGGNYIIPWNQGAIGGTGPTLGTYPSNADVWWQYRNTNVTSASPSGNFDPAHTAGYVALSNNQAAQGAVILQAFNQQKAETTGISGLTDTVTTHRPSNGCWFASRVFYTGVNDSFQPTGDAPYYTWTENIYFSQIITKPSQFGYCYQQNDPTNPDTFDLLPDDGGVIVIQGAGAIYKLFPVQNGLLVFAANGIWFITGSQGIGFTAVDYTVTKISGIQSISSTSYVNVLGWPVFWNEEGIYQVQPSQQGGGLQVNNLCLGTILSFYADIPLQSKKFARGDYNPITFVIQWLYRSTNSSTVTGNYQFDSALNLNTYKAPFYPYTINAINPYVSGINYVAGPGGSNSPEPTFKYLTVVNGSSSTFSEEKDFTTWKDWNSFVAQDYVSTFTTGYKLHGQMQRQFGVEYIYVFSNNVTSAAYSLQSLWDFSTSGNSGKWSAPQVVNNNIPNFGNVFRRLRLRGHGLAVQLKFTSISGQPFNFVGWSILENQSGNV